MKQNKLKILWTLSLSVILLASCESSNAKKWSYSRDDMSDFMSLSALIDKKSETTSSFVADTDYKILGRELKKDDVIVFDIDKAKKILEDEKKAYADYSVLKEASVSVSDIKTASDLDGFEITFDSSASADYGMLIHSSATFDNAYLMVSKYVPEDEIQTDPQERYEENYVNTVMGYESGVKFAINLIANVGTLIIGLNTSQPTAIWSGLMGILGNMSDSLVGTGTSIADVMNMLKEMDRKLDEISDKIDKNSQMLADEIVRAEALVDQATLNTLNVSINDFANNSLAKINDFNRNLADEYGFMYRDYVKSEQTVDLLLTKGDDGKYRSTSLGDITSESSTNFSLKLSDFTNAKAHLAAHGNVVENGFIDELNKDIKAAIESKTDLPEGIDKDDLVTFVSGMIAESFMKQYFASNTAKAQEYRNLMINYAQRISGASGMVSMLNTYLSRFEYMYNFGSEIKGKVRSLCAFLLQVLDMNTARAAEACLFAGLTSSDLETNFKSTREAIQSFYKSVKAMDNGYSFTTNANLTGGFYKAQYNVYFTNPGNHCNFHADFQLLKLDCNGYKTWTTEDSLSNHVNITAIQHARIVTRWNLLRSLGEANADSDYLTYLVDTKVIDSSSIEAYKYLNRLDQTSDSCYRIVTGDRNERNLNSSDTGLELRCTAKGNPGGSYYFDLDVTYGYRQRRDNEYWSGKTFESTMIDGISGSSQGTQKICSWAKYAEDHWYWSDDEYWGFTNNENQSYFFMVDIKTAE